MTYDLKLLLERRIRGILENCCDVGMFELCFRVGRRKFQQERQDEELLGIPNAKRTQ